jgi:UDPglucose 6-dehydrogenase
MAAVEYERPGILLSTVPAEQEGVRMSSQTIGVVGIGYVGLIQAVGLAEFGFRVVCLDIDRAKIDRLRGGIPPIFEDGLVEQLSKVKENLVFETDAAALAECSVVFICTGTPTDPQTGNAQLDFLFAAAQQAASNVSKSAILVVKSTVPIGTCKRLQDMFDANFPKKRLRVVSNPEFLREGQALSDFFNPDRIVVGGAHEAVDVVAKCYTQLTQKGIPLLRCGLNTAETIKYASNAFLATKLTFINEIANLTETVGGDIEMVATGLGLDSRIGPQFLKVGPGYGGSCFPKDTLALAVIGRRHGAHQEILEAVIRSNDIRRFSILRRVEQLLGGRLRGKTIGVLGLTFKAGTDDLRDSPALTIIHAMNFEGARVKAYDPVARVQIDNELFDQVDSIADAIKDVDLAVIVTEWPEFADFDFAAVSGLPKHSVLFDLRLVRKPNDPKLKGWRLVRIGISG